MDVGEEESVSLVGIPGKLFVVQWQHQLVGEEAGLVTARLFYSYSHKDERHRERLETHLSR